MQELLFKGLIILCIIGPSWILYWGINHKKKESQEYIPREEKYEIIPLKSYKFRGYILIPSIKNIRKSKEFKRYYNY